MSGVVVLLGRDTLAGAVRLQDCQAVADRIGGLDLRFVDSELPEDEVIEACQDAVAILPAGARVLTPAVVAKMPNLRLIQTFSAGTEYLDDAAFADLGVAVSNNGGANAIAVAEHAIALMVAVYRKLDVQIDSAKAGTWMAGVTGDRFDFHTLVGKRVGIVGLGRIGSRVARRLAGWECEVVYHDLPELDAEHVRATGATRVPLDELLETSDIVTLHVPLDASTRHMISEREFALMKQTAILINTCRGSVVDEAALIGAMEQGEIFGAGIDVVEVEPIEADNPLPEMANVILTPHLATRAVESEHNAAENALMNAGRVARGEAPLWVVRTVSPGRAG
ncbi:MAG: NAD(P)-dependent oxidoreductase [Dehalococcoidia bacterium]|nr:NAD(P)-dependent oxidoreductase [Dehalococcoidia bacterium]